VTQTDPMTPSLEQLVDDDRITLWGLVLEAQHQVSAALRSDLADGMPYPEAWFEVLLRLGRTPGGSVPMTKLARMVLFSSGGFTKLADRMEAEGLLRRVACPGDRRSSLATLTPKGRRALEKALRVHVPSLERHVASVLDASERAQLEHIMRKLRASASPPGTYDD
jgi:DNA-binding MarR family transcriptional regulator